MWPSLGEVVGGGGGEGGAHASCAPVLDLPVVVIALWCSSSYGENICWIREYIYTSSNS